MAKIEIFSLCIGYSFATLWVKYSLKIALSLTISEIFTIFHFPLKSKMAAKSDKNWNFSPLHRILLYYPVGKIFARNRSISYQSSQKAKNIGRHKNSLGLVIYQKIYNCSSFRGNCVTNVRTRGHTNVCKHMVQIIIKHFLILGLSGFVPLILQFDLLSYVTTSALLFAQISCLL